MKILLTFTLALLPYTDLFREPEFIDARNFRLASLGLKESRVRTDLFYYNPNNFGLNLRSADLDVFINNKFAGKSLLDTLVHIPARDTFFVPVTVKVDMKNVFPNALALLMQDSAELKVVGKVKVAKGPVAINVPVNYREMIALGNY